MNMWEITSVGECCHQKDCALNKNNECIVCEIECEDEDIGQYDVGHEDDYQQEMPEKF